MSNENEGKKSTEISNSALEGGSPVMITDESFKRKVVAFTVGAVVLLCLLIVMMCYQMIKISVVNRKKADLILKIAELDEQFDKDKEELAFRRTNLYIERIARELGYHYADDIGD